MTDEEIEKILWLNRAFHADNKIKALEAIRERNKSIAERRTATYGGLSGSSTHSGNSQEAIIHAICDDNIKIQERLAELVTFRQEISDVIEKLHDDELETIMHMRYLAYMKTYQIAEILHYDRKTIQRKHKIALSKIECP